MSKQHSSSPFMDLLTSQQESHNPDSFPHLSPTRQHISSQISPYSTQYSTGGWCDDSNVVQPSPKDVRRKWSPKDDIVLISAWLNTSKDVIVGNEQKAAAFWKRVAAYYASSPAMVEVQKREASHCKQRWQKINETVNKFVGCYTQATSLKSSGQSEDDVIKTAYIIFSNDHKQKFTLEHAWRELRYDQKWLSSTNSKGDGSSKRKNLGDGCTLEEEAMVRPPGVKAAKGKGKKCVSKSEEREASTRLHVKSVWTIREKDLAIKERLRDKSLLDSLLQRT